MLRLLSSFSLSCIRLPLWILAGYVLIPLPGEAQLCTGSLGDPVVEINFGTGTNQAFTAPGYTYIASACPNDGFYTIASSSAGCFNNTWHTVTGDHTGNGAFMLVNASFQPGDFFLETVTNLCPNTTYEFSAWIMNVLRNAGGIQPDITFRIETLAGVVLNQFTTGNIPVTPQPEWRQYGFFFTAGAGNPSVVLRMRNNAPGGNGNDLALDDISFRPCGPDLDAVIRGQTNPVEVCINDQQVYALESTVSAGFQDPVFQWQVSTDSVRWNDIPGAGSSVYQRPLSVPGTYWYRNTVAERTNAGLSSCRIASSVLKVQVYPRPVISAGPDKVIIAGSPTTIQASAGAAGNTYSWSPATFLNDPATLNPVTTTTSDIVYTLLATSAAGCTQSDQVRIQVVAGIFVPTAFTPNNDGRNDRWRIPFLAPDAGARVRVFNRWGQVVYEVNSDLVNWDGTYRQRPQPAGIYVYEISFRDRSPGLKGTFCLVR